MNHYTYLIQSRNGEVMNYIGVRSCECSPEEDNYWGSSKHLPQDISDTHNRYIIDTYDTRGEAVADEIWMHDFFDVAINPKYYNKAKQTSIGFDTAGVKTGRPSPTAGTTVSEENKQKTRDMWKGKVWRMVDGKRTWFDKNDLDIPDTKNPAISEIHKEALRSRYIGKKWRLVNGRREWYEPDT